MPTHRGPGWIAWSALLALLCTVLAIQVLTTRSWMMGRMKRPTEDVMSSPSYTPTDVLVQDSLSRAPYTPQTNRFQISDLPALSRVMVRDAMRKRGLPTGGKLFDYWVDRLSVADQVELYLLYALNSSPVDARAGLDEQLQFLENYINQAINPTGKGYSVERTNLQLPQSYSEAMVLIEEALDPNGHRLVRDVIVEAMRSGDDSQVFFVVAETVMNVGRTVFNSLDMELVRKALDRSYADFLDQKYNLGRVPREYTYIEYLAYDGDFWLGRLLPEVDWAKLSGWTEVRTTELESID